MANVFLSYSRRDEATMRRLRADLEAADLTVWTDEGLVPGEPSWQQAIEEAIEAAGCLVVILSPPAKDSKWVRRELEYADAQGLTIIPALASGESEESVPMLIIGAQRDVFPRRQQQHHQHQLSIGSHLIVCDRSPECLWSSQRQVELLEELGCSIHCVVSFGDSATTATPALKYVFETHVTGEMLLRSDGSTDQPEEMCFSLADINGRTDGNAFWLAAHEVHLPFLPSAVGTS